MSDTWVAMDGRDPTIFFTTCWICDCGPYIGPVPAELGNDVSWVPGDADEVDWLIAKPKPDGDAAHVADNTYSTRVYFQQYRASGSADVADPHNVDTGAHLFAVWFDPAYPLDPALLATPSASPLDLVPANRVSGGRLVIPPHTNLAVFEMPITTPNVRVVGDSIGLFAMPITMPAIGAVTASGGVSIGVLEMPINMPPMFLQVSSLDNPPADFSDLGAADPVYSEDGPA